ncbi:hypothetical protein HOP50_10g57550 [Chloropicon primus]|uniref:Uncharacterized protein n=1 Tax=Chloropicon primus TaxID=1764295 RepID=A0A5B8MU76_9CHLO|nr:hypothetical protein A3770_10p57330 [Chloropicon primus]UPR02429.1 hypothetical protein HOP50_10g57550 [Chloropicon primus]|mmetsp:Transcript_11588/g.32145  ORF Transcript_11588/g.32145 Transcript_11588/m.32145 type:complete len:271 (+) Transcript_11588:239-1051(+)|eukprot:QDZ23215.1 hypothetical protein A3770_10p57330 [Chloropicon primus]
MIMLGSETRGMSKNVKAIVLGVMLLLGVSAKSASAHADAVVANDLVRHGWHDEAELAKYGQEVAAKGIATGLKGVVDQNPLEYEIGKAEFKNGVDKQIGAAYELSHELSPFGRKLQEVVDEDAELAGRQLLGGWHPNVFQAGGNIANFGAHGAARGIATGLKGLVDGNPFERGLGQAEFKLGSNVARGGLNLMRAATPFGRKLQNFHPRVFHAGEDIARAGAHGVGRGVQTAIKGAVSGNDLERAIGRGEAKVGAHVLKGGAKIMRHSLG